MDDLVRLGAAVEELTASYGRLRDIAETLQAPDARDILEAALELHQQLTLDINGEIAGTGHGLLDDLLDDVS